MARKNKNKSKQRKQKKTPIKTPQTGSNKFWIGGLAAMAVAGAIAVGIYSRRDEARYEPLLGQSSNIGSVVRVPIEIPFEISFKQAVDNEDFRQSYLEQLVEEEVKVTREWKGFGKVIYDRDFKQFERDTDKKVDKGAKKDNPYGLDIPKGKRFLPLAVTEVKSGKIKSFCYVSKSCFDKRYICSENELKSLLDNEVFHAYTGWKGRVGLNRKGLKLEKEEATEITKKADEKIKKMAYELMSFDYQYFNILNGKRKVSRQFIDKCGQGYIGLYNKFKEISQQDDINGAYAKIILNSLKVKMRKGKKMLDE